MVPTILFVSLLILLPIAPAFAQTTAIVDGPVTSAAIAQDPARVVVLYSDELMVPSTVAFSTSFRDRLLARPSTTIESQFLEISRVAEGSYDPAFVDWLTWRYRSTPISVVVSLGVPASMFADQYGTRIWPGARFVHAGIDGEYATKQLALGNHVVEFARDYRRTVEEALALMPWVRRVILLAGASEQDKRWLERAMGDLAPLATRVTIEEIAGLRWDEMLEKVRHVPVDSAILPVVFFADADARSFVPADAFDALIAAANRPALVVMATSVRRGALGGYVVDSGVLGRATAQTVLDVLAERESRLQESRHRQVPPYWMFDAQALRQWGISERALPGGSVIVNRDMSLWARYRGAILGAFLLIGLQAALIAGLIVQRGKRRRAELQAHARQRQLAHLNRVATLNELTGTLIHELGQPLTSIMMNAQAAQRFLEKRPIRETDLRESLADIVTADAHAGDVIRRIRMMLRRDDLQVEPLDVNALLDEVLQLTMGELTHNQVIVTTQFEAQILFVHAERVPLQQVFLNLIMNACEAMSNVDHPRLLTLRTCTTPDGNVEIEVADCGTGISRELIDRVFEPFFTTKPKGIGLGLSICWSIVETQKGRIQVSNNSERGATFCVTLPGVREHNERLVPVAVGRRSVTALPVAPPEAVS